MLWLLIRSVSLRCFKQVPQNKFLRGIETIIQELTPNTLSFSDGNYKYKAICGKQENESTAHIFCLKVTVQIQQ